MRRNLLLTLLLGAGLAAAGFAAGPHGRQGHGAAGPGSEAGPGMHRLVDADGDGAITAAEWNAHFEQLDADGDGRLIAEELPHRLHHRGFPAGGFVAMLRADGDGDGAVTADELTARLTALDADGDGSLTVAELHAGRPMPFRHDGRPPFLARFDADGDGRLAVAELEEALFAAADANDDGELTGDELRCPMHQRGRRHW